MDWQQIPLPYTLIILLPVSIVVYCLLCDFYKIDLECDNKNAVKPTLAKVFLGLEKKSLRKNDPKTLLLNCT